VVGTIVLCPQSVLLPCSTRRGPSQGAASSVKRADETASAVYG
jgi:hypothetical protein